MLVNLPGPAGTAAPIRSKQTGYAKRGPVRDWLRVASPAADPVTSAAREIIQATAQAFGVTAADILGERRPVEIIAARFAAYHAVATAHPGWSFVRIGRVFGRDHTTILTAIRKMERTGVPRPPALASKPVRGA